MMLNNHISYMVLVVLATFTTKHHNLKMNLLKNYNFGFLQSYSMGAITAQTTSKVDISQSDIDKCEYFNTLDIINSSTEDIAVYLDGNTNRAIHILAGTSKSMNGTRFRELVIYNKDAANNTAANEIIVTIQKELGFREQLELGALKNGF